MTADQLVVTRLLQSPLGAPAPPGEAGDIVAVSDGDVTLHLSPYDKDIEVELRCLLASSLRRPTGRHR